MGKRIFGALWRAALVLIGAVALWILFLKPETAPADFPTADCSDLTSVEFTIGVIGRISGAPEIVDLRGIETVSYESVGARGAAVECSATAVLSGGGQASVEMQWRLEFPGRFQSQYDAEICITTTSRNCVSASEDRLSVGF